jgi:hypothetical protein
MVLFMVHQQGQSSPAGTEDRQMSAFQKNDLIEFYPGENIAFKGYVLKVAKNGRVFVERWFSFMNVGEPELRREWRDTKNAVLVRRRG